MTCRDCKNFDPDPLLPAGDCTEITPDSWRYLGGLDLAEGCGSYTAIARFELNPVTNNPELIDVKHIDNSKPAKRCCASCMVFKRSSALKCHSSNKAKIGIGNIVRWSNHPETLNSCKQWKRGS